MKHWFGCATLAALVGMPGNALAGELRLSIANGRVNLVAQDVTLKQILDEWARVGQTQVVGAERLTGGPISLELTDVAEGRALESLLRSASGYIAKPRAAAPGISAYDRILIMPASRPPAVSAAPPPVANRPQTQVVVPNVVDDDMEPGPITPPGVMPQQPLPQQFPGQPPFQPAPQPGMQPGTQPGMQTPITSPRPGQLPPPPPGMPGSPYQLVPQQPPVPQGIRPPGSPSGPGGGEPDR
jgi:hypothetical protein